jgi:hypothetical protein
LGVLGLFPPQNLMDVFHESPLFRTLKRINGRVNGEHWEGGYPSNLPLVRSDLGIGGITDQQKAPLV